MMSGFASTPACAGLTLADQASAVGGSLYPRVRGADAVISRRKIGVSGGPLPPRARG